MAKSLPTASFRDFRSRDPTYAWKLWLRSLALVIALVAIILTAVPLTHQPLPDLYTETVTGSDGSSPYSGDDYSDFGWPTYILIPWQFITLGLSFIWCLTCILVPLFRKGRYIHPGAQVACDLLLWLSLIVTIFFAAAGGTYLLYSRDAAALTSYGSSPYGYGYGSLRDISNAVNRTTGADVYSNSNSSSDPSSPYNKNFNDTHYGGLGNVTSNPDNSQNCEPFSSCDALQDYANAVSRSGAMILAGVALACILVLFHFALFVSACRYENDRRHEKLIMRLAGHERAPLMNAANENMEGMNMAQIPWLPPQHAPPTGPLPPAPGQSYEPLRRDNPNSQTRSIGYPPPTSQVAHQSQPQYQSPHTSYGPGGPYSHPAYAQPYPYYYQQQQRPQPTYYTPVSAQKGHERSVSALSQPPSQQQPQQSQQQAPPIPNTILGPRLPDTKSQPTTTAASPPSKPIPTSIQSTGERELGDIYGSGSDGGLPSPISGRPPSSSAAAAATIPNLKGKSNELLDSGYGGHRHAHSHSYSGTHKYSDLSPPVLPEVANIEHINASAPFGAGASASNISSSNDNSASTAASATTGGGMSSSSMGGGGM